MQSQMKNLWWEAQAAEMQQAADAHHANKFYSRLKAIYGPQSHGFTPLHSADNAKLIT